MPLPAPSVIIPAYNAAAHLPAAVESVLSQNEPLEEILVIDDGSTDATPEVARTLPGPVRYLRQDNAGPAATRNRGIALARSPLLAFIDADDLWPPGKLRLQMDALEQEPDFELILGLQRSFRVRPEDGTPVFQPAHFMFLIGTGLYRRAIFDRVGLFDETMRYSEDTDWFFRAWEEEAPMRLLWEPTLWYRLHEGGMTHGRDTVQKGYMHAVKKSLERRRRKAGGAATPAMPWLFKDIPREKLEEVLRLQERRALAAARARKTAPSAATPP